MSFFKQTLKARLNQNKNKYPFLKLNDLLDWAVIADILRKAKKESRQDRRGNPSYAPLKMFKDILLGQWHSLSDPALEHALSVHADFIVTILRISITPLYAIIGIAWGILYWQTKNLWSVIIAHTLNNSILNLLHITTVNGIPNTIGIRTTVLVIVFLLLTLLLVKRRKTT